ncbi:superoxide dismutase [Paraphysoderma sedebokerense]|nr:superoxide dismutase [Paraphysoderma sedebokerense]
MGIKHLLPLTTIIVALSISSVHSQYRSTPDSTTIAAQPSTTTAAYPQQSMPTNYPRNDNPGHGSPGEGKPGTDQECTGKSKSWVAVFKGPISDKNQSESSVAFRDACDGNVKKGVEVIVNIAQFNASLDYSYHIHQLAVPANGSCNATAGHYNPKNINYTVTPPTPKKLETYELGDLSGKHGPAKTNAEGSYQVKYIDPLLNLSDLEGRSIVFHTQPNNIRVACGNILPQNESDTVLPKPQDSDKNPEQSQAPKPVDNTGTNSIPVVSSATNGNSKSYILSLIVVLGVAAL